MTETKFTPGPWIVRTLENFGWNIVHYRNGDRHDILRVAKVANETDAHLIAAAPWLYEALEAMVDRYAPSYHDCTDDGLPECEICEARDALAKARGEA